MSHSTTIQRLAGLIGLSCAVACVPNAAYADAERRTRKSIVAPRADAKYQPLDPADPGGVQMAVLWGDPKKGPSGVFIKVKRGPEPLHYHTINYEAVLVQGSWKHWDRSQTEQDAKTLSPGDAWFQPARGVHADLCLSDECVVFVAFAGKFDFHLAEQPKK